ncbi:M48 family metalloprotease [Streptomyces diastatochromogenes]|uniref:Peptidase M48 domain-containing protein n=1 Tax=Streptomyces diastatochromogenes TaxID=42236 RepID=A0A233RVY0_STRDA|nr:M48 family metalloprotease [Streptomyces diastatochromogenes]MCZ0991389.1 hypothetical protein [Streptomyces diastatochromogenes]OXY87555.1 hypothetical protein BEK98_43625 [Streptomyces diastatochromogenes]
MTRTSISVPTATTGRFVVMAAAALGSSSFAYRLILVNTDIPPALTGPVGMVLLLASTIPIYLVQPAWIRRRLVDPDLTLDHYRRAVAQVQALATASGLRRCPRVMFLSSPSATYAQAFGRYPNYCVWINSQRLRDPSLFDGVVRHELRHIRLRDVDTSRLAIGMAWAFVPVVLVPYTIVVGAENVGQFVREDLWRLLALGALVYLMFCSVMRTRELHADVGAMLPESAWDSGSSKKFPWLHPSATKRKEAAADPTVLDRLNPWLGAATGVAAGIAVLPVVDAIDLLSPGRLVRLVGAVAGGLVVGLVIASVIGPAMWRLAAHGDRIQARFWLEGLTIGGGVLIGSELSVERPISLSTLLGDRLWAAEIGFVALLAGLQALLCRWIVATAPVWQNCAGPQDPVLPTSGPEFRSVPHLLGGLITVVLPTAAVWAFFLWSYDVLTSSPRFFDEVLRLFGHQVSSPPGLLDQFELFGVAAYDALMIESLSPSPVFVAGMVCICVPLALTPLRDVVLWRRTVVVIVVGAAMFLIAMPFLARLLGRVALRADEGTESAAQFEFSMLTLWQLPMVVVGIGVAVAASVLAVRAGHSGPALYGTGAAVVHGLIVFAAAEVSLRLPASAFTSLVAAPLLIAPLSSLAVTGLLGRLLHRPDEAPPRPPVRLRSRWRLVAGTSTAGAAAIVASFLAAHRLVPVPPSRPNDDASPLSADEQTARCVTGRWHVLEDAQTVTIMGEKAPAVGGESITWSFRADGRFRRDNHAAEFLVKWRSRVWRMVYDGASEGTWRIEDGKLVLVDVTWTDEIHTLYFAPHKPMGKPVHVTTGSQPEGLTMTCVSPYMTLELDGHKQVLNKMGVGQDTAGRDGRAP